MADCLSLLRQYNIQKKEILERDDLIIFGNVAWPKTARTNYVAYKSAGQGGKEYYTLESLLFLLKNVGLSHPMYVQRAGNQNIPVIKFPDRRGLLSYLNGELETTPSIDRSVHLEMGIPAPYPKRSNDESHPESVKRPRLESDEVKVDKQRLAVKLGANKKGGAITDQIRPLSETMSVEKIAAIKAKRLAKKRATIRDDDIDDATAQEHGYLDDATHSVIKRQRCHKTRASVLQSTNKTFSNIFSLLQTVKSREEGKMDNESNKETIETVKKPGKSKYNRYDQERFGKEATGDFSIVTTGTYHGMTLKTMTEVASKPIPEVHTSHHEIETVKEVSRTPSVQRKDHRHHRSVPIIILPSSPTSVITTYNAREFFEEFKYIPSEEKRKSGSKKTSELTIYRKKPDPAHPGQTISKPFRVTDNPLRLSSLDWKQVVAVFVAGPMWQFKGWPDVQAGGSPVDIFTKMKAFHIKFDDEKLDSNIQLWDVEVLKINKRKRYLDKASMLRFWDVMDKFVK
ncbi:PREDICTED: parafibromin-like [Amphimedon queenslandica]|uniref:Parafibromin n=1 Tax=Amphimedon queenslandica TaxID=400682 RepID=A0A1X7VBP9_AMPQE|nr:PREDICTED: parafibromin-like [Amphimedon queenslandica]|eukprot:XP_003385105.2 PREDICTED: parafibromin-like [Amphimedon queenslandica]